MINIKKVLPLLAFIISLICPAGAACAATLEEAICNDLDLAHYAVDSETETSLSKKFVDVVREQDASYWTPGSGNYYIFSYNNEMWAPLTSAGYDLGLGLSGKYRPYLVYSESNENDISFSFCYWDTELNHGYGNGNSVPVTVTSEIKQLMGNSADRIKFGYRFKLTGDTWDEPEKVIAEKNDQFSYTDNNYFGYSHHNTKICRIITNVPIFLKTDTEAIDSYCQTGDISGAANYDAIMDLTEPEANNSYTNKSLKLDNLTYHGQYLNLGKIDARYFSLNYWAEYPGYNLDDMYLDIFYQYDYAFGLAGSKNVLAHSDTLNYSTSFKLRDCQTAVSVYPHRLLVDDMGLNEGFADSCFGGFFYGKDFDVGDLDITNLGDCTSSLLTVSLRLRAVKNGDNDCSSKAYTQVVDLLTGECDSYYSNADEEGNYTRDEEKYKTTDKDGNVTINNNVSGGGGSGGGSSSASGGNATATVGDITNTFKFPDKIDINLKVKDIDIDLDITQKKGFWENLLETGNLVLNYIKTFIEEKSEVTGKLFDTGGKVLDIIDNVLEETKDEVTDTADKTLTTITGLPALVETLTTGFTLFSQEDGLIGLYRDTLDMFPPTFWTLVYASISVGIIHLVMHYRK